MAKRTGREVAPVAMGDAPVPLGWDDELESYVDETAEAAEGGVGAWPKIRTSGATFSLGGEPVGEDGRVLPSIILGARRLNLYYDGKYDPENIEAPKCFAIGVTEKDLAPPADLETKQADSCAKCWANAWGSGNSGRGKACSNKLRLAILPASVLDDPMTIAEEEGFRLEIPVTSVKRFATFFTKLAKGLKVPSFRAVTSIAIEPDSKTQQRITPELRGFVNDEATVRALVAKADEAKPYLDAEPPRTTGDDGPAQPAKAKGEPRRRKVTKRSETPARAGARKF